MEMALETNSNIAKLGEPSAAIIMAANKLPPRDLVLVEKNIRGALLNNPVLAEQCIYCRPVGKDKETKRQNFSTGPSIRFTELGQQCFGRLWLNGNLDVDFKSVRATFMCFDLWTMNITFGTCSKSIFGSGGMRYPDGMVEVTGQAAMSIARRNALTQQMRPQLESCMIDAKNAAIKKWSDKLDGDQAFKALLADYQKRWGTTDKMLKELVADEGTPEDKLILIIGVRNYLIDNPSAYKDVFGVDPGNLKTGKTADAPVQTEKQKYNTLALQIEAAGKKTDMDEIVSEFMGKIAKGLAEMDESEYEKLCAKLEGLVKK